MTIILTLAEINNYPCHHIMIVYHNFAKELYIYKLLVVPELCVEQMILSFWPAVPLLADNPDPLQESEILPTRVLILLMRA